MSKKMYEWNVNMPWGKLAMVSWGKATNPPILLVHGLMDSAATFIPLMSHLPDEYYYVAFDIPGHGKSMPFPEGIVSHLHIVEVICQVVSYMKWKTFIYVGHSMGCIVVVSWGKATNPPILLVHGLMDSAATFIPLMSHLPEEYYYVAFDIPGHGKSMPFPEGIVSHLHIVEVICQVVSYMKWKTFIYVGHSMGCIVGMFYNHLKPGKITTLIYLDTRPALAIYYFTHHGLPYWFHHLYPRYYDDYERYKSHSPRLYTANEAIKIIANNRNISEEHAKIVLSRSLVPADKDKYTLSWAPISRKITGIAISEDIVFSFFTKNTVPTLLVNSSIFKLPIDSKLFTDKIIEKCKNTLPNYEVITIDRHHDVHISDAEFIAERITQFIAQNSNGKCLFSKL